VGASPARGRSYFVRHRPRSIAQVGGGWLSREWHGSHPGERAGKLCEHGQVRVKLDTLKPTDPARQ